MIDFINLNLNIHYASNLDLFSPFLFSLQSIALSHSAAYQSVTPIAADVLARLLRVTVRLGLGLGLVTLVQFRHLKLQDYPTSIFLYCITEEGVYLKSALQHVSFINYNTVRVKVGLGLVVTIGY